MLRPSLAIVVWFSKSCCGFKMSAYVGKFAGIQPRVELLDADYGLHAVLCVGSEFCSLMKDYWQHAGEGLGSASLGIFVSGADR